MRKSLLKTPPSGLSSRLAPPAALVAVDAARRPASRRNGSAPYTGVPRVRVAVEEASALSDEEQQQLAARVRLLEGFISRTDVSDTAQHALQWIGETLGIAKSICLVRPMGDPALFAAGQYGFTNPAASSFTVSLEEWGNPLVNALNNRKEVFFPDAHSAADRKRRPATPFDDAAFHVVPLGVSGVGDEAFGLLLLDGRAPVTSELHWFISVFVLLSTVTEDPRQGSGVVSILRNVTDLRRASEEIEENYRKMRVAEAQARAESDRLNLIIDSVADPIVVTDASGATSLMNEPAERLFTIPSGASEIEQRWVQTNDAHFSSFIAGMLVSADQRRNGEIGLVDPKLGEPLPVEAIAGKILSEHGELTAVVTILHDRREAIEKGLLYEQLKQASDELERKIQAATADIAQQNELLRRQAIELEQASALKSQFLANMSHEFRTPLNAILGYTSMLLQGVAGNVNVGVKRQLGRIESNGRHLLTIINEILDISRIEAGRMPLQISKFRVPELLAEVKAELEPIILRSKLTVTLDLHKELRPISTDRQK